MLGRVNSDYRGKFGADTALVSIRPNAETEARPVPGLMRFSVAPDGSAWD